MRFQFKVNTIPHGWANVVHFTSTGQSCCSVGSRIPAVMLLRNKLHVFYQLGGNGNFGKERKSNVKPGAGIIPGRWYDVDIQQYGGRLWVVVDGMTLIQDIQPDPREYTNVKVYAGLSKGDPVADGNIKWMRYIKY